MIITTQFASPRDIEAFVAAATGVEIELTPVSLGLVVRISGVKGSAEFFVTRGYDDGPVYTEAPALSEGFSAQPPERQGKLVEAYQAALAVDDLGKRAQ